MGISWSDGAVDGAGVLCTGGHDGTGNDHGGHNYHTAKDKYPPNGRIV